MRIDKYLWCVRLFKSRTLATEAIAKGRVKMGGEPVKASRMLSLNEEFTLRRGPATFTYRVKGFPPARVGAKLVEEYLDDLTPQSERELLMGPKPGFNIWRAPGSGRPTKKERRELESFTQAWQEGVNPDLYWEEEDEEDYDE